MIRASWKKYTLNFKQPAGTSRGIMEQKDTWILKISDSSKPSAIGIGECNMFKGLSCDDRENYEEKLNELCSNINEIKNVFHESVQDWPSIRFGLEMTLKSLNATTPGILFPSDFTTGKSSIPINGLIWMGSYEFMRNQILKKIKEGFRCIKIKIGAINFDKELSLIRLIRKEFSEKEIEIRVDANGAFDPAQALEKLKRLSDYQLHSIEQPIRQGQWEEMAELCHFTPLPIALDEELIGVHDSQKQKKLIETIHPQFIILKPSLLGGFRASEEWISLAKKNEIAWWVTSALESNIGLNAIAQWTYTLKNPMSQGLGTGGLFNNNFPTNLHIKKGELRFIK